MPSSEQTPELTSAMEDYLEAIYHLEQERRIARVRDIANRLGVKMSSVSSALKSLSSRGFIRYDPHQFITLTERGIAKATDIVRRHEVVKRFLHRILLVDEKVADESACRLEHHLDAEVMERLVRFITFVETCPVDQTRWLDGLAGACDDCRACLREAEKKVAQRDEAQKAALGEGMTLLEADEGSQVVIESIKGSAQFRRKLARENIEKGMIAEIEEKDSESETMQFNVKGYHVSLGNSEAEKILVKPIL